jgi:aconitate hydratase
MTRTVENLELDLTTIEPSIAGPKRPQDRVALRNAKESFNKIKADEKFNNSYINDT